MTHCQSIVHTHTHTHTHAHAHTHTHTHTHMYTCVCAYTLTLTHTHTHTFTLTLTHTYTHTHTHTRTNTHTSYRSDDILPEHRPYFTSWNNCLPTDWVRSTPPLSLSLHTTRVHAHTTAATTHTHTLSRSLFPPVSVSVHLSRESRIVYIHIYIQVFLDELSLLSRSLDSCVLAHMRRCKYSTIFIIIVHLYCYIRPNSITSFTFSGLTKKQTILFEPKLHLNFWKRI